MIEYRAVLRTNKKLERPVQSVSLSLNAIEDWIKKTIAKYPEDEIILYKSEEVAIGIFLGEKKQNDLLIQTGNCLTCNHTPAAHLLTCKISDQTYGACSHITCDCKMLRMEN